MKFSKVVYIERDDFMENPPSKYHRLSVGKEVRLKHAYFVKCESFVNKMILFVILSFSGFRIPYLLQINI